MGYQWEEIPETALSRMPIYGGWLVMILENVFQSDRGTWGWDYRPALTFVPDPNHEWKTPLEKEE